MENIKKEVEHVDHDKKVEKKIVKTTAEKMWDEIRSLELLMFSLPGQTVELHCTPVIVEPNRLYLTIKSGSVLPALEETLGKNYNVEVSEKYIIVSKK
jgi:hypothetical protein